MYEEAYVKSDGHGGEKTSGNIVTRQWSLMLNSYPNFRLMENF